MKQTTFLIVIFFSFKLVAQTQTPAVTYDPKFYDKLKWRNIGPERGGDLSELRAALAAFMNIISGQQVVGCGKLWMAVRNGFP